MHSVEDEQFARRSASEQGGHICCVLHGWSRSAATLILCVVVVPGFCGSKAVSVAVALARLFSDARWDDIVMKMRLLSSLSTLPASFSNGHIGRYTYTPNHLSHATVTSPRIAVSNQDRVMSS